MSQSQAFPLHQIAIKSTQENNRKQQSESNVIKHQKQQIEQEEWQNYKLFNYQVSGKSPKLISLDNKYMLKQYNKFQYNFYNILQKKLQICHPYHSIVKFMPKLIKMIKLNTQNANKSKLRNNYQGSNRQYEIWIKYVSNRYQLRKRQEKDYSKFIILENFLLGYSKPNIFDIKIGTRQQRYSQKTTQASLKYKFRLNGIMKDEEFISKSILKKVIEYQQIKKYIGYFYSYRGHLLHQYIQKITQQLKQLVLCIKCMKGWKFISTSICLYYDSVNLQPFTNNHGNKTPDINKCSVKFIDFSRTEFCYMSTIEQDNRRFVNSQDTCLGLQFIIRIFKQIIRQSNKYKGIVISKDQEIVPANKLNKYRYQQPNLPHKQ